MAEKSYPDAYPISDLPDNPVSGFIFLWRTANGWIEKLSDGKVQRLSPDQTYLAGSKSTAPISHAAIASVVGKTTPVESVNPPNLDDPHWGEWHQNTYDFSKMKRTVQVFWRTPSSNDLLPLPITWEFDVPTPNPANATADPGNPSLLVSLLPQDVSFRFRQTREANGGMLCDISFPANTFTGIAYQLVDSNKALIAGTARGQQVTATDTAAGLGWATVPANARFAQFTFAYRNGGNLPFEFAIT